MNAFTPFTPVHASPPVNVNGLQEQATAMRVVLFVRVGEHLYDIGSLGCPQLFEPRSDARAGPAMLYALAQRRGVRVELTHLLPESQRKNPRACARGMIDRAMRQIENVSLALAAALASVEVYMEGDRLMGHLPARANGLRIETQPMTRP